MISFRSSLSSSVTNTIASAQKSKIKTSCSINSLQKNDILNFFTSYILHIKGFVEPGKG